MLDELIKILMLDHARNKNVVWGVDKNGKLADEEIIWTEAKRIWQEETKTDAENITPHALIEKMNRYLDENGKNWPVQKRNWQAYVAETKLEMACGEAPFVVERFDESGVIIPLRERTGFLDKKLIVVSEYCNHEDLWWAWAKAALHASYGYDLRGDMVIWARRNVLFSFVEHWNDQFPGGMISLTRKMSQQQMKMLTEVAEIIAWNIFQMDGRNSQTPDGAKVKIMDWERHEVADFENIKTMP